MLKKRLFAELNCYDVDANFIPKIMSQRGPKENPMK